MTERLFGMHRKPRRELHVGTTIALFSFATPPMGSRWEQIIMISDLKEVVLTADLSAVVIKAEAIVGEQPTAVELAITTELAAKVAIALLATTAEARAARDGLEPALRVLAAAFVPSGCADKVRLHLLFQQGVVLPIEMDLDAAKHLGKGLPKS